MTAKRAPTPPRKRRKRPRPTKPAFWTDRAVSDLESVGDHIALDNPAAAERWVGRLVVAAQNAASAPLAGRRVPELARDDVREVFLRTYRIVYRITDERVEVLTVFEGHRLFPGEVVLP